ncbi:MAG: hypothetical protein HWE07_11770 [Cytophagia bacterium]|nr:hypothetical protein [Cytophagia bacterium]
MRLKQNKLLTTKEFTIVETGLIVKLKTISRSKELQIPFEEIQLNRIMKEDKVDITSLVLVIFFGGAFLISLLSKLVYSNEIAWGAILIMFVLLIIGALSFYANSKRLTLIPTLNNGYLILFTKRPTSTVVNSFLESLSVKYKEFLKSKYGIIDRDYSAENQLSNFLWLKDQDVISEEEFLGLKNALLGKTNPNQSIGFRPSRLE